MITLSDFGANAPNVVLLLRINDLIKFASL